MTEATETLTLEFVRQDKSSQALIRVSANHELVRQFYHLALSHHQHHFNPYGFQRTNTPTAYVDAQYRPHLLKHLAEFLLNFLVISFLYRRLREEKLAIIGNPRLKNAVVDPDGTTEFIFEVTMAPMLLVHDWKYLPFKAPKRRLYKDIDKQASNFIEEESAQQKNYQAHEMVQIGDWIQFSVQLLNKDGSFFAPGTVETLWLQIGEEETSLPFQELFVGRKIGETFFTNAQPLQEYFSSLIDTSYPFAVTVNAILPKAYFNFDQFRDHFRIKNDRKLHQRIVEIYSSKHDLSLRRNMVEEAMRVLNQAYPLEVPENTVDAQEKTILKEVQNNPDYTVYKQQRDFLETVRALAEKQIKETIIIDHFAYQEQIPVTDPDVACYLNFTKRQRTKEFLHFVHPMIKVNEEESPISHESLKQVTLREKTLNHVLYHLNK